MSKMELLATLVNWYKSLTIAEKSYILNSDKVHRLTSSRPKVFCKKGVLRNFAKFTGKHLCQSQFFNKVTGLMPASSPSS